jgi:hypothetical protein
MLRLVQFGIEQLGSLVKTANRCDGAGRNGTRALTTLRDKDILISSEADAPKDTSWRLRPSDPLRMSEDIISSR